MDIGRRDDRRDHSGYDGVTVCFGRGTNNVKGRSTSRGLFGINNCQTYAGSIVGIALALS